MSDILKTLKFLDCPFDLDTYSDLTKQPLLLLPLHLSWCFRLNLLDILLS